VYGTHLVRRFRDCKQAIENHVISSDKFRPRTCSDSPTHFEAFRFSCSTRGWMQTMQCLVWKAKHLNFSIIKMWEKFWLESCNPLSIHKITYISSLLQWPFSPPPKGFTLIIYRFIPIRYHEKIGFIKQYKLNHIIFFLNWVWRSFFLIRSIKMLYIHLTWIFNTVRIIFGTVTYTLNNDCSDYYKTININKWAYRSKLLYRKLF
jgi:hypothetical protein